MASWAGFFFRLQPGGLAPRRPCLVVWQRDSTSLQPRRAAAAEVADAAAAAMVNDDDVDFADFDAWDSGDEELVKAVNALDAAHDRAAEHGPAHVIVRTDTPRNEDGSIRAVRLAVRDNGPGFPDKVLRRAFEPYLTTKAKGTGLGLAVVKKIADEHKALVRIRNLTANPSQPPIETGAQGNSPGAPRSAGAHVSLSFSVLSSIPHQSGSH